MLGLNAPLPRLRIYTTADQYLEVLGSFAARRAFQGDDVGVLERDLERRLGVAHAIAMPMARVGIYVTLKNLIRPGQKVILSPYTIADVVNMVICAGGRPVFADIDRATCDIDPNEIERLIDDETGAVLATHFYGMMADVERIRDLCDSRGIPFVEDAAQAFGATWNGRPAGTIGRAGVYSFGMYKNVNSYLGGMVVTDDARLAEGIRGTLRDWPFFSRKRFLKKVVSAAITDVVTFPPIFKRSAFWLFRYAFLNDVSGINDRLKIDIDPEIKREMPPEYRGRMMPVQARLIRRQLDRVERQTKQRIEAARIYREGLQDIDELILAPEHDDGRHIYWYFPIQHADRHALVSFAMRHHRDITESYHRNCASLSCFAEFARHCPNAQATADSLVYLPTYPRYSHDEVKRTVAVIRKFFGR